MISIVQFKPAEHPLVTHALMDHVEAEFEEFRAVGFDRAHMMQVFAHPSFGCVAAVDKNAPKDHAIVGLLLVSSTPIWYNPAFTQWSDLFSWVRADVREQGVFSRMVGVLEVAARQAGVKRIALAQSSGHNVQETADLYGRMGYRVTGFLSVKEL